MKKEKLIEQLLESLNVPENKSDKQIWDELNSRLNTSTKVLPIRKRNFFQKAIPFAAAACVALGVFFIFPSNSMTAFENETNVISSHTLPDGSLISLSPDSKLEFDSDEDSRDVILSGEAFFNVEKGIPFTVTTENGEVSVLGTSFYVTSRDELLDVKCFTGKVKVNSHNSEVFLVKGEGMSNVTDSKYNHASIKKWENGELNFDNVPLNIILEDLKLFKEISVINDSDINPSITLELDDESEEEVIKIISTLAGLNFKLVGESKFQLYNN